MSGRIKRVMTNAIAMMAAASMRSVALALPSTEVRVPPPPHVRGFLSDLRARKRARRREENEYNRVRNLDQKRRKRINRNPNIVKEQALINRMTNWQRNQWARNCDTTAGMHDLEEMERFASMPHWKQAA